MVLAELPMASAKPHVGWHSRTWVGAAAHRVGGATAHAGWRSSRCPRLTAEPLVRSAEPPIGLSECLCFPLFRTRVVLGAHNPFPSPRHKGAAARAACGRAPAAFRIRADGAVPEEVHPRRESAAQGARVTTTAARARSIRELGPRIARQLARKRPLGVGIPVEEAVPAGPKRARKPIVRVPGHSCRPTLGPQSLMPHKTRRRSHDRIQPSSAHSVPKDPLTGSPADLGSGVNRESSMLPLYSSVKKRGARGTRVAARSGPVQSLASSSCPLSFCPALRWGCTPWRHGAARSLASLGATVTKCSPYDLACTRVFPAAAEA